MGKRKRMTNEIRGEIAEADQPTFTTLNTAETYAKKYLSLEIQEIQRSERLNELINLSSYEKAIIYKYSEDGYENVNEVLRNSKGTKNTELGEAVNYCLSKLSNFIGIVYRCVDLSSYELQKYVHANDSGKSIKEYPFISTSKSRILAMGFGKNTLFRIYSKTGKEIEKIAKFGIYSSSNEKEVLFKSGRCFTVVEITKQAGYTTITMEEI